MDPLSAALVAAVVAWLSILVVVSLPGARLPARPVKVIGGLAVLLFGLIVLGLSVPGYVPLAFLGGGILGVWLTKAPSGEEVNDVENDRWLRHAEPEPPQEEEEEPPQTPWL